MYQGRIRFDLQCGQIVLDRGLHVALLAFQTAQLIVRKGSRGLIRKASRKCSPASSFLPWSRRIMPKFVCSMELFSVTDNPCRYKVSLSRQ